MKNPSKLASKFFLVLLVCIVIAIGFSPAVSAQNTVVKAEASTIEPNVGNVITVYIKISNAQQLFGVDVTLSWNPSVLTVIAATAQLGVESHSGGVLHESSTYPIEIDSNNVSQSDGQYHLLATSTGLTTPAFTGSGNIATLTFKVTATGSAGLTFDNVELSIIASDGSVSLVTPSTSADTITAIASGSSSTPNTSVPEFTNIAVLGILIIIATATALSTKLLRNRANYSIKVSSAF